MRSNTSHFECDRCHDKCDNKDVIGLGSIQFEFTPSNSELNDYAAGFAPRLPSRNRIVREWCRKCRVEVGLLVPRPPEKPQENAPVAIQPTPATFEDLLREIIREEIHNEIRG